MLLCPVSIFQLFQPPAEAGVDYFALWSFLLYVGFTMFEIPRQAWTAELSRDYVERSRIEMNVAVFNILGSLVFWGAAAGVVEGHRDDRDHRQHAVGHRLALRPAAAGRAAAHHPLRAAFDQRAGGSRCGTHHAARALRVAAPLPAALALPGRHRLLGAWKRRVPVDDLHLHQRLHGSERLFRADHDPVLRGPDLRAALVDAAARALRPSSRLGRHAGGRRGVCA